jgi:hypothetical protein
MKVAGPDRFPISEAGMPETLRLDANRLRAVFEPGVKLIFGLADFPAMIVMTADRDFMLVARSVESLIFAAEIELQVLAGIRLLLAISETPPETSVERMLVRNILERSCIDELTFFDRRLCRFLNRRLFGTRLSVAHRSILRLGRVGRLDSGLQRACALALWRSNRLFGFGLVDWCSGFTYFGANRVRIEYVAASRTLEGRCLVRQNPLVNPVAGVTTSALDLYHRHASPPGKKISTPKAHAHPRNRVSWHEAEFRSGVFRCA